MAESLPTSVSAFSHRRPRADSNASFAYYDEEALDDEQDELHVVEEWDTQSRRTSGDLEDIQFNADAIDDEDFDDDSADASYQGTVDDYALRRRSSTQSRSSVHAALLRRDSSATAASYGFSGRMSQKVYMANEDLTIAVAGFRTTRLRRLIYSILCISTFGIAFLLCRWLPRWHVRLLGQPCTLRDCDWVVVENQWRELSLIPVSVESYGRPVSTVFGFPEKIPVYGLDDDTDPVMDSLRMLDYRYVRFYFHPLKDKFVMCSGWKDADWTDVRLARSGLDSDEKILREVLFGNNMIDIQQKSTFQLLVDEVRILPVQGGQHHRKVPFVNSGDG